MLLHKTYETEGERDAIITEMLVNDLTQVSTEGIFVGKHLLFDDGKPEVLPPEPEPVRNLEKEIDELEARVSELELVRRK